MTGSYTGDGTEVSVDTTLQVGQSSVIKYKLKLTEDQFDGLGATGGGVGGGPLGVSGSDIPIIGGAIAAFLAAIRKLG